MFKFFYSSQKIVSEHKTLFNIKGSNYFIVSFRNPQFYQRETKLAASRYSQICCSYMCFT